MNSTKVFLFYSHYLGSAQAHGLKYCFYLKLPN